MRKRVILFWIRETIENNQYKQNAILKILLTKNFKIRTDK